PIANPPSIAAVCRDKLATQQAIGRARAGRAAVRMPEVEGDPDRFADALAAWGAAFVKPRFGSFGDGVSRVVAGDAVPAAIEGQPVILQRAVPPPVGWAGVCVRVLVQREADGWVAETVVRRSRTDPVVNAARGAEVAAAEVLGDGFDAVVNAARAAATALAALPDGEDLLEVGVDVVVDDRGAPWVVEVNGRPLGRLEVLAAAAPDRWADAHLAACARPLRWLALRRLAERRR
ncbi:MAG: YheC/YheD family protein, partial [Myxococcota bacterium]